MEFFRLLVIAMTVEVLWETTKMFWQDGKANIDRIGAAVFGVFLCLSAGIDFFELVQVPLSVPISGKILSGLLVSRGANFIHDLISMVESIK